MAIQRYDATTADSITLAGVQVVLQLVAEFILGAANWGDVDWIPSFDYEVGVSGRPKERFRGYVTVLEPGGGEGAL